MTKKTKVITKPQIDKIITEFGVSYGYLNQIIDKRIGMMRKAEKEMQDGWIPHYFNKEDNPIADTLICTRDNELFVPEFEEYRDFRNHLNLPFRDWDFIDGKRVFKDGNDPLYDFKGTNIQFNWFSNFVLLIEIDEEGYYCEFYIKKINIKNVEYLDETGKECSYIFRKNEVFKNKFFDLTLIQKLNLSPYLAAALKKISIKLTEKAEEIIKEIELC